MLEPFAGLISAYASMYGVPISWIRAVILTESSGDPNAFRSTSARDTSYGLMQLTLPTAYGLGFMGDASGLFDPDLNIHLGTKLLGQLRAQYGDDAAAVYSAYNSGNGSNYLTNPSVAAHVENFLSNLSTVITDNPVASATTGVGLLIVVVLIFYFMKGK